MKSIISGLRGIVAAGFVVTGLGGMSSVRADEVTDWNRVLLRAEHVADVSPIVGERVAVLVHAAVFDAVNGIERRYEPIYVIPNAPRGASPRAAAAQAAYTILVELFPDQKPDFDAELAASLAGLMHGHENAHAIPVLRGIAWGNSVANAIWAWRSTDGFASSPPPFMGGTTVGEWRPTPPGFFPGAAPQVSTMTPWGILSPSQFRPTGPPSLTSDAYTADFNEAKSMGSATSTTRSADQTLAAEFWGSANGTYFWNRVALSLGNQRRTSLLENAHLLAMLNLAMADARIACWDAKYTYVLWRPVTAIPLAETDENPATEADVSWTPLLGTPNHPEYPSGHSTTSGAAAAVLAHHFGEHTQFVVDSDWMPGVTRSFSSFSAALEEVKEARIFGGIHFRSACNDGQATGQNVADYLLSHAMQRSHDGNHHDRDDDDQDHGRGK